MTRFIGSLGAKRLIGRAAADRMNAVTTNEPEMIEMCKIALELREKGIRF